MDYGNPSLANRLAAEYVLGTLRGPARRRFDNLLLAHAGLRDAVAAWQAHLNPMALSLAEQAPSPAVWRAIQARIGGSSAPAVSAAASASPSRGGFWASLGFWRGFSAFATVATLAFGLLLANPSPTSPPVVIVLSAAGSAPDAAGVANAGFVASVSGDGRAMVTRPIMNVSLQAGRALELWSIPVQAGGAPRSLGLISQNGSTVVSRGRVLDNTAAFAVSLEPAGGSPTGAPTGPVLYVGKLTS
jgi:anti-sigma-K factor RskA